MIRSKKFILSITTVLILVVSSCSFFDFVPPEINFISPGDGEQCYGKVVLRAKIKDKYLDRTELYINGNKKLEYTESDIFDSLTLSEGTNYTIKLKAFDKRGNWREEEVSSVTFIGPRPPTTPSAPSGPTSGYVDSTYSFSASTTDPNGDSVSYQFDWGDGNLSSWSSYVSSSSSVSMDHSWSSAGTYSVKAKAKDVNGDESAWSSGHSIFVSSIPPNTPSAPSGPTSGYVDSTYSFSTSTTDPNGDSVSYQFDWGDGNLSSWSSYVSSGSSVSMDHSYSSAETYSVKAKAKDESGVESPWSTGHSITISGPGSQKWALSTGNDVYSSPAIGSDGTIYVGSRDNNLYAINPDGSQKWAFSTGNDVLSSPAIGSDGTIYVGSISYNNNLYAINPDGSQKWVFSTEGTVFSSPAISSDGTIYVGCGEGNLYAINPDGSQKWAFSTGDGVNSSPAISSEGTIYVGSNGGNLYAINPDGSQKWVFSRGGGVRSSPTIGSGGTIYVGSDDYNLYAINPDGSQKWVFPTGYWVYSSPAIGSDGTIYVGGHNLYAINPDGSQKWAFSEAYGPSSPAIGSDGTIYVGSNDYNLYAINPDGTKKWAFPTGDNVESSPVTGSDGTIYVGSRDNNLYAIYGSSGGLANTPWPMFHHDLKHSGREGGP